MKEYTKNGIRYTWDISSSDGADFMLFPEDKHTPEDVMLAKIEIRGERDVVTLKIATDDDRDELYRSDVFSHPQVKPLKWFQINADNYRLIRKCRKSGMSIDEYVNKHVLPCVEQIENANLEILGSAIYSL